MSLFAVAMVTLTNPQLVAAGPGSGVIYGPMVRREKPPQEEPQEKLPEKASEEVLVAASEKAQFTVSAAEEKISAPDQQDVPANEQQDVLTAEQQDGLARSSHAKAQSQHLSQSLVRQHKTQPLRIKVRGRYLLPGTVDWAIGPNGPEKQPMDMNQWEKEEEDAARPAERVMLFTPSK